MRWAVVLYVVIYRILTPPYVAAVAGDVNELTILRAITDGALEIMLIVPVIFMKRAGYFHPLVFPAFLLIATNVAFAPAHLFLPFVVSTRLFATVSPSWAAVLIDLDPQNYAQYRIQFSIYSILYYASLYFFFFQQDKKAQHIRSEVRERPAYLRYIPMSAFLVCMACVGIALLLFRSSGGLEAHIVSLSKGRYETLSGSGVSISAVKAAIIALFAWMAGAKTLPLKSPMFILTTLAVLPVVWIVDGSRSTIIYAIIGLLAIAAIRMKRLPVATIVMAGVLGVALLGVLGSIRHDFTSTSVNTSVFDPANFGTWLETASTEIVERNAEEGDLAAFVAADRMGFIWGQSYLSVLAFPMPRIIWENKPRTGHAYNTWVAFFGNPVDGDAPAAWGIPLGPIAEAYWNFGAVGIVLVGGTVGLIFGTLLAAFKRGSGRPELLVLYVIFLLYFSGGSRETQYVIQYGASLLAVFALAMVIHAVLGGRSSRARGAAVPDLRQASPS
ncbi:O-antigen polymerase [uncultured Devosia sp.]|uniref:O-antigen polymerase n=1 Tax=uncultured Devosia sp. TaxID=211434 RepID=UPI0035CC515A